MTDLLKAAKMALKALEMTEVVFDADGRDFGLARVSKAREALRQALAQQEQEPVAKNMTLACPQYLHGYTAPQSIEAAVLAERKKAKAVFEELEREVKSFLIASIQEAVLAEREACAKLCDKWNTAITDKLAAAIRARGEK